MPPGEAALAASAALSNSFVPTDGMPTWLLRWYRSWSPGGGPIRAPVVTSAVRTMWSWRWWCAWRGRIPAGVTLRIVGSVATMCCARTRPLLLCHLGRRGPDADPTPDDLLTPESLGIPTLAAFTRADAPGECVMPIRIRGAQVGVLSVSGLESGGDHELALSALQAGRRARPRNELRDVPPRRPRPPGRRRVSIRPRGS